MKGHGQSTVYRMELENSRQTGNSVAVPQHQALVNAAGTCIPASPTSPSREKRISRETHSSVVAAPSEDPLISAMSDMVHRYSQNFPLHNPSKSVPSKDIVLITGATGALGATLLGFMVPLSQIERIYVLNRRSPTGVPLLQRQMEAMIEAGFDASQAVDSPKVVLLETDLPEHRLGLPDHLYDEIRTSITHIFHNAYLVNFNVPLAGFEPNIKTLRHIIDLALASPHATPPRPLFVSTAAVWSKTAELKGPVKEELTPLVALGGGYGQSKWVCEHILDNANQRTPLRPVIARVGQISGGPNGAWNSHDWVPAMIRSSIYLGCIPLLENDVAWIPVHAVAGAIVEMRNSPFVVHHLEHPRPVHWNTILKPISRVLHLPLVPYAEWLARLNKSGETIKTATDLEVAKRRNPAWSLVNLFRETASHRSQTPWRSAFGQPVFDMSHSLAAAPCLSEEHLPPLSGEDAVKWLQFWRRIGILDWQEHANL